MAIQLETGEYLLSVEQAQELRHAANRLNEERGRSINLMQPITFESWLDLVVVQATLNGDDGTVDSILNLLEDELAKRRRLN